MKVGFYDYATAEVGVDGVIYKEPLTSFPVSGATEAGAGVFSYDENGFAGTPTSTLLFSTIAGQSDLATEGSLSVLVSKEAFAFEDIPAAATNFLTMQLGNRFDFNKSESNGSITANCGGVLNHKANGLRALSYPNIAAYDDDLVPLVMSWDQTQIEVWVDHNKMWSCAWLDSDTMPDFTLLFINGRYSSGGTYHWKNIIISNKKINMPTATLGLNVINMYGNSYMQQGGYPRHSTSDYEGWPYRGPTDVGTNVDTIDGLTATSANGLGSSTRANAGIFITLQRELSKAGLYTGELNGWFVGGGGVEVSNGGNTVRTRVTASLLPQYHPRPDVAVIVNGYNDCTKADQSTMQGSWQAMIDEITASNTDVKIIACTQPYHDNASFVPTLAQVQAYNVIVGAIGTANAEVTVVDIYTIWGGAADEGETLGYWNTDNIHPSNAGHVSYGKEIAVALISVL